MIRAAVPPLGSALERSAGGALPSGAVIALLPLLLKADGGWVAENLEAGSQVRISKGLHNSWMVSTGKSDH